jgi:hypothetical protein
VSFNTVAERLAIWGMLTTYAALIGSVFLILLSVT